MVIQCGSVCVRCQVTTTEISMMSTGEETPSLSTFILCTVLSCVVLPTLWLDIGTGKDGRKASIVNECPGAQNGKGPTQFSLVARLSIILSHNFGETWKNVSLLFQLNASR